MNRIIISGRCTKDWDLKFAAGNGMAIAKNSVAVERITKGTDGKKEVDFINVTAFGKTAEYAANYGKKGGRVVVSGRLQLGNYKNKEGEKIYTTDVMVDQLELMDFAETSNGVGNGNNDGAIEVDDGEIPF